MSKKAVSPSVVRNEAFRRLWVAQFTSLSAAYAVYFASMVLVEEITHSSTQMGLMILSSTLPGALFGLVAGVVVDHLSRRRVLVASNALQGLVALSFLPAARSLRGGYLLIAVYLINFLLSAISQFLIPAEAAVIPQLVGEEKLLSANSLFSLTSLGAQGVGLVVVAPLLVKLAGVGAVYAASALLNGLAALLIALLPHEKMLRETPAGFDAQKALRRVWAELREGWRFIASDRSVFLAIFHLTLVSTLILTSSALAPGFVARVLGLRVDDAAYLAVPAGVGFLLGTVMVGRHGHWLRKERWINSGLIIVGLALALLAMTSGLLSFLAASSLPPSLLPLLLGLTFVLGLGLALILIPARTLLQERPAAWMRGRVISVQLVLGNMASLLPMLFVGALADLIGITRVMMLVAALTLASGVASISLTAGLRKG